jgi:hypothetical protein
VPLLWRACLLTVSAVLAGAVAIALVTGPAGDRPGLERGGAATTAPQLARAGAAATAKSAVRAGDRAQQGRVLTTAQPPPASSSIEHSSRGNRARSTPASRSPLLLAADDLPPLTGRIEEPPEGLRAGPLVLFGSEDPNLTIQIVGSGMVTLTDPDATPETSCTAYSTGPTSCTLAGANEYDPVTIQATSYGTPESITWSGGLCTGNGETCGYSAPMIDETDTVSLTDTLNTSATNGTVSVTDDGGGVTCDPTCQVGDGDKIVITASPNNDADYTFADWSGNNSQCASNIAGPTCTIYADGPDPETDTAVFTQNPSSVTIGVTGTGSVSLADSPNSSEDCGPSSSASTVCPVGAGDQITLTAVATNSNWTFEKWTGGGQCNGSISETCTTFTAGNPETDTAVFTQNPSSVTIGVTGTGSVSLADSPNSSEDCGPSSSASTVCPVGAGDQITLTAVATNSNWTFEKWTGGGQCNGSISETCTTFTAGNPETDTAVFTQNPSSVTIGVTGTGSVSLADSPNSSEDCGPSSSASTVCPVGAGDQITLTAVATNSNWTFEKWTGGGQCNGSISETCTTFTAGNPETDTAVFTQNPSSVTIGVTGTGSVSLADSPNSSEDCGPSSSASTVCPVGAGDQITLTAVATNSNWTFEKWTGGGQCNGSISETCTTFTAGNPETDTAVFTQNPSSVTIGVTGTGSVSLADSPNSSEDCGPSSSASTVCPVGAGDQITLTAVATNSNWTFEKWTGGGQCNGSISETCTTFTAGNPETDTAVFTQNPATITTDTTGPGTVTLTDTSNAAHNCPATSGASPCTVGAGDLVSLNAAAGTDYMFVKWTSGTCSGSTNATCPTFAANTSETDTAEFTKIMYTLTVNITGSGTVVVTDAGTGVTCNPTCQIGDGDQIKLMETPGMSENFVNWTGGGQCATASNVIGNTCTFNAAGSETDVANFVQTYDIVTGPSTVAGEGAAKVTDANPAITCTDEYECVADAGDDVTITPLAAAGFHFVSWSGVGGFCGGRSNNPCVIAPVGAPETDIPVFEINTDTIDSATSGAGTVAVAVTATNGASLVGTSCNSTTAPTSCLVNYGDTVTLTETPSVGHNFTGWTTGQCAIAQNDVSPNTCSFIATPPDATDEETDTAKFVPNQVPITAMTDGNGVVVLNDLEAPSTCDNLESQDQPGNSVMCTVSYGDPIQITALGDTPHRQQPRLPLHELDQRVVRWHAGACAHVELRLLRDDRRNGRRRLRLTVGVPGHRDRGSQRHGLRR